MSTPYANVSAPYATPLLHLPPLAPVCTCQKVAEEAAEDFFSVLVLQQIARIVRFVKINIITGGLAALWVERSASNLLRKSGGGGGDGSRAEDGAGGGSHGGMSEGEEKVQILKDSLNFLPPKL